MSTVELAGLFACPECRGDHLEPASDHFGCPACGAAYPLADGIPVLVPPGALREAILTGGNSLDPGPAGFYNRGEVMEGYFALQELPDDVPRWRRLLESAPRGLSLEVGSGSGIYQDELPGYVALDLSLFALRRCIRPPHPRVCASAESLPFRSDSFEVVISRAAIEHVPRPALAYAEILRILKPGGMGYLMPSWNCTQWTCDALPIRPYRELTWAQKFTKLTLPVRRHLLWKGAIRVPWRISRAVRHALARKPPELAYRRLQPNYERYWSGDADACCDLDVFETYLYYRSRGCTMIHPGPSRLQALFARAEPVVFLKAGAGPAARDGCARREP